MACALRMAQLIDEHNAKNPDSQLSKENIYVLEKAREVGQHCLSGALLDPRSMRELLPGFEKEAPLDAEVTKEGLIISQRILEAYADPDKTIVEIRDLLTEDSLRLFEAFSDACRAELDTLRGKDL